MSDETETFEFEGCKHLKYDDDMTVPRQGISLFQQKALCYARFDMDGQLQLVQYCIRGRMNFPEAGIPTRCCSDFEIATHKVIVPIWELDSSPRDFLQEKEKYEQTNSDRTVDTECKP
jgi:hypothetical protein